MLWGMLFPSRQCVWTLMMEVAPANHNSLLTVPLLCDLYLISSCSDSEVNLETCLDQHSVVAGTGRGFWDKFLFLSVLGLLEDNCFHAASRLVSWEMVRVLEGSQHRHPDMWMNKLGRVSSVWEHIWRHRRPLLETASWARPIPLQCDSVWMTNSWPHPLSLGVICYPTLSGEENRTTGSRGREGEKCVREVVGVLLLSFPILLNHTSLWTWHFLHR